AGVAATVASGAAATGAGARAGAGGALGGAPVAAACGLVVAPAEPAITATMAPTGTVAPAGTRISASTPAAIAGTSIDTLSVSISNRLSPGLMASPTALNQVEILPSATVSPSCGISTSMSHCPLVSRARCSVLHAAAQTRDPGLVPRGKP